MQLAQALRQTTTTVFSTFSSDLGGGCTIRAAVGETAVGSAQLRFPTTRGLASLEITSDGARISRHLHKDFDVDEV